jgi:hypothetical protein
LSTQIEEGESCLPAEDGHRGVLFVGEAGRPGPTSLGGSVPLPSSVFFQQNHIPFVTFVLKDRYGEPERAGVNGSQ